MSRWVRIVFYQKRNHITIFQYDKTMVSLYHGWWQTNMEGGITAYSEIHKKLVEQYIWPTGRKQDLTLPQCNIVSDFALSIKWITLLVTWIDQ